MDPAITFLFVGPAINILAVTYTGVAIGMDIALVRIILSAIFGIGLIMAFILRRDEQRRSETTGNSALFADGARIKPLLLFFMALLLASLIVGTLGIDLFRDICFQCSLPIAGSDQWQVALDRLVAFDASQGQEGCICARVVLVILLGLIGIAAWMGLNSIYEGFNRWSCRAGPHCSDIAGSNSADCPSS